jgi:hypothetical protein
MQGVSDMSSNAEDTIITAAFVTIGSTVASDVMPKKYGGSGHGIDMRHVIGGMAAFTLLLLMEKGAPSLASAFAILIGTIAFLYNATPLLERFFTGK